LKTEHGGVVSYTDDEIKNVFSLYDFDKSAGVTKDEMIWARKMKGEYFKSKAEALEQKKKMPFV